MAQSFDFYWGSYTEGLRRHGGEHCTWFTVFRHPVSRLGKEGYFFETSEILKFGGGNAEGSIRDHKYRKLKFKIEKLKPRSVDII